MIYETRGRAREYFELAANHYSTCEHACRYCYAPEVLRVKPDDFFQRGKGRQDALKIIRNDAARLAKKGENRHVLLSFIGDPYQPAEAETGLTRNAIKALHDMGLYAAILTKGGMRAVRDFDVLAEDDLFGVSLTCELPLTIAKWEMNVSLPYERIRSLELARAAGIGTWVSCEPVVEPAETLALIEKSAPVVDFFMVGKLNYRPEAERIHWKAFAEDAVKLLDSLGKPYYIKRDLARFLGKPDGIVKGNIPK